MGEHIMRNFPVLIGRTTAICHGPIELNPYYPGFARGQYFLNQVRGSTLYVGGVSSEIVSMLSNFGVNAQLTRCGVNTSLFVRQATEVTGPLKVLFPSVNTLNGCHSSTKRAALAQKVANHYKNSADVSFSFLDHNYSLNEMPSVYQSNDVILILSKSEGNPLASIEGPACGTTLVSTPVGIVPNLIENGVNGFILDGSTDEELFVSVVKTLDLLAKDWELLATAKSSLCEKVRSEHNWDVVSLGWDILFTKRVKTV